MLDDVYGEIPPGTLAAVTIQTNGAGGESGWQTARSSYYGISGTPTMWFDGAQSVVGAGSTASAYAAYRSAYNARMAVTTDVTVQVGGRHLSDQTYEITVKVGIESGGTAKTMRVFIVQVLDDWPFPPTHTPRYGFVQAATTHGAEDQVTVSPGGYETITRNFTFSGDSWTHQDNIKIVAWAAPQSLSSKTIHQAAVMHWPFTPLQLRGDMNGDWAVNLDDLPLFALALADPAAYELLYPDIDVLAAGDIDGDGFYDGKDIQPFVPLVINDQTPPSPNPMTWSVEPASIGTTTITMTATTAIDSSGVEYYFFAQGLGSHHSNWISSPVYTDPALRVNTSYNFKVQARDLSPQQNTTGWSSPAKYATTHIETPTSLTVGTITSGSIQVTAGDTFTNLNQGSSGLYFEVTDMAGTPVGAGTGINSWTAASTSKTVTAAGLEPDTTYRIRVKARNRATPPLGTETPWYPEADFIYATTSP